MTGYIKKVSCEPWYHYISRQNSVWVIAQIQSVYIVYCTRMSHTCLCIIKWISQSLCFKCMPYRTAQHVFSATICIHMAGMHELELTVTLYFKRQTFFSVVVLQPRIRLNAVVLLIQMYSCNFCIACSYTVTLASSLINTAWYPLAERKYLQESPFETVLFHEINIASVFSEFIGHNQIVVARSAHHAHISEFLSPNDEWCIQMEFTSFLEC